MFLCEAVHKVLQVGRNTVFEYVVLFRVFHFLCLAGACRKSSRLGYHQVVFLEAVQYVIGLGQAVFEVVFEVIGFEILLKAVVEYVAVVTAQRYDGYFFEFACFEWQYVVVVLQSGYRLFRHLADKKFGCG